MLMKWLCMETIAKWIAIILLNEGLAPAAGLNKYLSLCQPNLIWMGQSRPGPIW